MNKGVLCGLAAGVALAPVSQTMAAMADGLHISAGDRWVVETANNQCVLNSSFQLDDQTGFLSITADPIGPETHLRIALPGQREKNTYEDATMAVDGDETDRPVQLLIFDVESGFIVHQFAFQWYDNRFDHATNRLGFDGVFSGSYTLDMPQLSQMRAELKQCQTDLEAALGIDTSQLNKMVTSPEGNAFGKIAWPNEPFSIGVLYWVDEEGRVDECDILQTSGQQRFDDRVCADLIQKARLTPAKMADGDPIRVPQFLFIERRDIEGQGQLHFEQDLERLHRQPYRRPRTDYEDR